MVPVESAAKDRRRCPSCHSDKLTRLDRNWLERLIGWIVGSRKYRCFICGYEFLAHYQSHSHHDD
jgi:hypothetical protein